MLLLRCGGEPAGPKGDPCALGTTAEGAHHDRVRVVFPTDRNEQPGMLFSHIALLVEVAGGSPEGTTLLEAMQAARHELDCLLAVPWTPPRSELGDERLNADALVASRRRFLSAE